ncbi:MAG TPA: hypothetical protein VEC36_03620 [Patescibacteria group bacterium]|nr:hypothetical protein [Patescibacteria group bacterium]
MGNDTNGEKMKWKDFFIGMGFGMLLTSFVYYYITSKNGIQPNKYVKLTKEVDIENKGFLRKGTILKIDKVMPEGFTRYILYLNLKGNEVDVYETKHQDEIIPYWMQPFN